MPRRAMPPAMHRAPTISASSDAKATRASGSSPATGMTAAATTGATAESGPRTRIREGPKTA